MVFHALSVLILAYIKLLSHCQQVITYKRGYDLSTRGETWSGYICLSWALLDSKYCTKAVLWEHISWTLNIVDVHYPLSPNGLSFGHMTIKTFADVALTQDWYRSHSTPMGPKSVNMCESWVILKSTVKIVQIIIAVREKQSLFLGSA